MRPMVAACTCFLAGGAWSQRLANLPKGDELQPHLRGQYIKKEVSALSRPSAEVLPEPAKDFAPAVKGRVGALVLERVETANIYVTIVNGNRGRHSLLSVYHLGPPSAMFCRVVWLGQPSAEPTLGLAY